VASTTKTPIERDHEIGAAIRRIRTIRGLSQTELGEKVGVTFQQIQKYERGANRVASSRLQRIAVALDVPVSTFFPEAALSASSELLSDGAVQLAVTYDRLDALDRKALDQLARTLAERSRA
jgi:transcriptional regulator with XRE-family HTH domain